MTRLFVPALLATAGLAGFPFALRGGEPAIIARARAYLAPESVLNAVTAVHYHGTLVTANPQDPTKETKATLDIVYQKPDRQRITATGVKTAETTSLDDFEAWQRVQDLGDPAKWRQTLLAPEQVRRLRANTWENLGFFRGLEASGGEIEDLGPATIDNVACEKIAFHHSPTIIFFRYFSLENGKLLYTETESGGSIREEGEILSGGIRFPKTLVTQTRTATGQPQKMSITFEAITVNETFPSDFFAVPMMERK